MKFFTEYKTFNTTKHREYLNITSDVEDVVRKSGINEGMVLVSAMHITAAVYVNDAESGLIQDIDEWLQKLAPEGPDYNHHRTGEVNGDRVELDLGDFEINAQDIPGWLVSSEGNLTVALDVTISDNLKAEGIARELVNRVQNLRKDSGLEITDRILLKIDTNALIQDAITSNKEYVCNEILANDVLFESLDSAALVTDLVEAEDAKIGLVKN